MATEQKPGEPWREPVHESGSFTMVFSDETGVRRTTIAMEFFIDRLRDVAGDVGFDIQTWGPTDKVATTYTRPILSETVAELETKVSQLEEKNRELRKMYNSSQANMEAWREKFAEAMAARVDPTEKPASGEWERKPPVGGSRVSNVVRWKR